jgi:hypothetical protein
LSKGILDATSGFLRFLFALLFTMKKNNQKKKKSGEVRSDRVSWGLALIIEPLVLVLQYVVVVVVVAGRDIPAVLHHMRGYTLTLDG